MTVYILLVIGTLHGHPQVAPVGIYQTAADCQTQWQLLSAGAMLNANSAEGLAGVCLSYKLPGKDA